MFYRMAAFTILVTLISTLPCFSQTNTAWRGRPWAENTNAPTWQALQENYQPFEQLFEALVEHADVVRATVNTNYPRLELVQTWTVDAGSVTNVIGSNDVIVASGFPLMAGGTNPNGTYTGSGGSWVKEGDAVYLNSGGWDYEWEIWSYDDWFTVFGSDTGPDSATWFNYDATPIEGITAYAPAGIEVNLITTNVVTTNAFGPFEYSVEVDGTTYSGTGFPHLTYAAMEWIDQTIEDLSVYFSPVLPPTNLPPSGASVWLWQDDWDTHGQYSLIGGAGVGTNATGTYMSGTNEYNWEMSAYTRQPPVTSQWITAEWVWGPTNWVPEVVGGETNLIAELGWINVTMAVEDGMDLRLPMGSDGPYVEAYNATSGAPISVEVTLKGDVRPDHWYNAGGVTNVTEMVAAGNHATNLFDGIDYDGTYVTGAGTATGDYVIVSYKGPITLYGSRPYRLYASDLDERAAVIDHMHNMPVEHAWTDFWPVNRLIPMWTNATSSGTPLGSLETTNSYVICPTNAPVHPPWSDIIPHPFTARDFDGPPGGTVFIADYSDWGVYTINRQSALFVEGGVTNLSNSVSVSVRCVRSAELMYPITFSTNTIQGTNFPSKFTIRNPVPCGWGEPIGWEHVAVFEDDQPFEFYEITPYVTNHHFRIQVTSDEHTVTEGSQYYTSGRIGSANMYGGAIPYNISTDVDWETVTTVDVGAPFSASVSWQPVWDDKQHPDESPDYYTPIPGFIDWGTTNGFRYRAAD